jgi:general secretion pathway protein E
MRQILIDHARERNTIKRGGHEKPVPFDEAAIAGTQRPEYLLDLDEALVQFELRYPRQGRVVVMRFYGGLTEKEIGHIERTSDRTVKRDWDFARAWLYAAISEINNGQDKIVTIEDPVEYQLAGVLQIPVNEKKGLNFARGLRSILRHDPDKIMVGEIRDQETANIAVQSALTGHLVFTTVHANNAFDVIGRFMHMNVDLYGFVSALNGILAQRLVRLNCPHCSEKTIPDEAVLTESGLTVQGTKGWKFMAGRGCRECRGSGYKGRKAVAELMVLNDELRELITARAPVRQLKQSAQAVGMRFLREAALAAVQNGETTLQEINRVTFVH